MQSYKASSATRHFETVGWRSFDLRTGFYDSESRARKTFTIRCFLKDHPRWQRFNLPDINDLVQVQGRLVGRLKHKDTRFQYLCCRIEDFTLFASQPRSEKPILPGSSQLETSLTKKGPINNLSRSLQPKGWTARSKSRIIQQSSPLTPDSTLSKISSILPTQPVALTEPRNTISKLSESPKRSYTDAFSSEPTRDDDLYTSPHHPNTNSQYPTPTSSSQPASPNKSPQMMSDTEYMPSTQPLVPDEPPRRSIRSRKPNSRYIQ